MKRSSARRLPVALAVLTSCCAQWANAGNEDSSVQALESSYDHLIELRLTQSGEQTAWTGEKEVLADRIHLLENEAARLQERVDVAKNRHMTVRVENDTLLDRQKEAQATQNALTALVARYETRARALLRQMPPPLIKELAPLAAQIPEKDAATTPATTQRLQTLLALLARIDSFNQRVTACSEIRDADNGTRMSCVTLYIGLGIAYYVDRQGTQAGSGRPGADAWVWTRDDSLIPQVRQMVSMYDNAAQAQYVNVKVEVR